MKFGFVILHYMCMSDTIECIESIKEIGFGKDVAIVVVDNASPDGSGLKLAELYENAEDVTVLLESTNLGFAKGNNIGYSWLKENRNPDFIITANNDIVFDRADFLNTVENLYAVEKYDVLGPDITDETGSAHMSPMRDSIYSIAEIDDILRRASFYLKAMGKGGTLRILYNLYKRGKTLFSLEKEPEPVKQPSYSQTNYDCVLQGSCFVFSPNYVADHEDAFWPGTFLYAEEHFLKHRIDRENGKMMYSPLLSVVHKSGKSTEKAHSDYEEKQYFSMREVCKSLTLLKTELKNDIKN